MCKCGVGRRKRRSHLNQHVIEVECWRARAGSPDSRFVVASYELMNNPGYHLPSASSTTAAGSNTRKVNDSVIYSSTCSRSCAAYPIDQSCPTVSSKWPSAADITAPPATAGRVISAPPVPATMRCVRHAVPTLRHVQHLTTVLCRSRASRSVGAGIRNSSLVGLRQVGCDSHPTSFLLAFPLECPRANLPPAHAGI